MGDQVMFSVLVVSKWCKLGGWEMLLLIKESPARVLGGQIFKSAIRANFGGIQDKDNEDGN